MIIRRRHTLWSHLKTLIGVAAVVGIEHMLGRDHWYGMEIDTYSGRESLYSIIRRRQDELREIAKLSREDQMIIRRRHSGNYMTIGDNR